MTPLILLSGGLDSVAAASLLRPPHALFVDYGQVCARGEEAAARFAAASLGITLHEFAVDLSDLGTGLLVGDDRVGERSPTQEWFPYRNQFLVTTAAAIAHRLECDRVIIGLVAGDSARHRDGSEAFVRGLSSVVAMQEGGIEVEAPFIHRSGESLLRSAALEHEMLHRTFSCHRSNLACGRCPGCAKRTEALTALGRSTGGPDR